MNNEGGSTMVIVNVSYKIKPGERDAFIAACNEINLLENTNKEAGNITYDYYLPLNDEDALFCAELWETPEAFKAHITTEHVVKFQDVKKKYVVESVLQRFEGEQKE
jgi:quinol monooxygenase YgiN